jgi:hypothetical protein
VALDETARATQARTWRLTLVLVGVLTVLRVVALFVTPLELYPDEAQYWLWSRHLDFGYFSKPPVIAWLIWATTRVGGDAEAWLRIGSPLINAGTALVISRIANRLYGAERGDAPSNGEWIGLAAAAIFILMPGIQLSSVLITTDTPLLFFLSLMIWACVSLPQASPRTRIWVAAGMGAALGMAFLSKYAAIYALASLGAHLFLSREARRAWTPVMAVAFFATLLAVFAPNMIWNYQHHFSTLEHTAANANWKAGKLFNPMELVQFVGSQFGVFGPVPFAVLGGGTILLAVRKRLAAADIMLLCFALPPLITVAAQAFVSRANANWAGAAYVAGSVLVAAWLLRWGARRWLFGGLALQAVLAGDRSAHGRGHGRGQQLQAGPRLGPNGADAHRTLARGAGPAWRPERRRRRRPLPLQRGRLLRTRLFRHARRAAAQDVGARDRRSQPGRGRGPAGRRPGPPGADRQPGRDLSRQDQAGFQGDFGPADRPGTAGQEALAAHRPVHRPRIPARAARPGDGVAAGSGERRVDEVMNLPPLVGRDWL